MAETTTGNPAAVGDPPAAASAAPPGARAAFTLDGVEFCLGTWAWGDTGKGWLSFWGGTTPNDVDDNKAAFRACVERGIRFFDTAEIYSWGESERLLGAFAADTPGVAVATKFAVLGPLTFRQSALRSALIGSLARLKMPSVDLYQVHTPTYSLRSVEVWAEGLADVYHEGLTRAVGVSNYNSDQIRRTHAVLARRGVPLCSNQIEYSLLHRFPETSGLFATCRELNVRILAYSPLAMGRLTGKYTTQAQLDAVAKSRWFGNVTLEQLTPIVEKLKEIGAAHGGKSPSMVALRWVIQKGAIPIAGAKNAAQAEENAGALGWTLTDEEMSALDAVSLVGKTSFWQGSSN